MSNTLLSAAAVGPSDGELLARFAGRRDPEAFAELLARHGPMVFHVGRSVLHNRHDAEDALQATFLQLARKAGTVARGEAVAGWLYRVARRVALRVKAADARRRSTEPRAAVTTPDPVLDMTIREARAIIFEELDRLPRKYRDALVLCGLEGKSVAGAADLLGETPGSVRGLLQRGRSLLRERLRRRGLDLPAALFAAAMGLSASGGVPAGVAASVLRTACAAVPAGASAVARGAGAAVALLAVASWAALAGGPQAGPPAPQPGRAERAVTAVSGRVLSPAGKPVPAAAVRLTLGFDYEEPAVQVDGKADADGCFRLKVPRGGKRERGQRWKIAATAPGLGCNWMTTKLIDKPVTLRLVQDCPIRGRVLDADGQPVAGAELTVGRVWADPKEKIDDYIQTAKQGRLPRLERVYNGPPPGVPQNIKTDAAGRFRLVGFGRERIVNFYIRGPRVATSAFEVMTRPGEPFTHTRGLMRTHGATFDYVGGAARTVRGFVKDSTGKPIPGVTIKSHKHFMLRTVSDAGGRYELPGLAKDDEYSLEVIPRDGRHFRRDMTVKDTPGLAAIRRDIRLTAGLSARGRVTDAASGKAVANARVEYHPLHGNPFPARRMPDYHSPSSATTTAADGSYSLAALPGPGVIVVQAPDVKKYMRAAVPLARRKAFFKTPLIENDDPFFLAAASGDNALPGVMLADFNAAALVEPDSGDTEIVQGFKLARPQTRAGRVLGPDGKSAAGVTAYGLTRLGMDDLRDGRFVVREINPAAHRPLVFHHKSRNLGYYLYDLRRVPAGPVVIKLQQCGSAEGRLVDADGDPVPGQRLRAFGTALRIVGEPGGGLAKATSGKDGRFRLDGLIPGVGYTIGERDLTSDYYVRAFATVKPGGHVKLGDIRVIPNRPGR